MKKTLRNIIGGFGLLTLVVTGISGCRTPPEIKNTTPGITLDKNNPLYTETKNTISRTNYFLHSFNQYIANIKNKKFDLFDGKYILNVATPSLLQDKPKYDIPKITFDKNSHSFKNPKKNLKDYTYNLHSKKWQII
ncbi:MAG: hypothetical protein KKG94_04035 [Nanoarchaeota archaeon]|nr:hypothetical protein [Nanoarchaeota archaeon]